MVEKATFKFTSEALRKFFLVIQLEVGNCEDR